MADVLDRLKTPSPTATPPSANSVAGGSEDARGTECAQRTCTPSISCSLLRTCRRCFTLEAEI